MKKGVILSLFGFVENLLLNNYSLTKFLIENSNPKLLEKISKFKAYQIYKLAQVNVPAYKKFLKNKVYENIEEVPYTDKKNYIKQFSYGSRCLEGKFPKTGNIEESSGSSGSPTNWIRSLDEEDLLFKMARFEFFYTFNANKKKYIVLSGWSSGPWATGLKFCEIIERYCLVKNSTADPDNIIRTLKQLGPKNNYLIAGYPPFLKNLFDKTEINWKKYQINIITGGESSSIAWKDYLRKKLGNNNAKIISSYGASDIDIGVGFETPFSEFIRKLALNNSKLNHALFNTSENAILFQYNPLAHYIENTSNGDFTITILDPITASPKLKYNLHDFGGKISYPEMLDILKKFEPKKLKEFIKQNRTLKLPFLFVAGRKDGTISIGGNNIYPEQISIAFQKSSCADKINRFMLSSSNDSKLNTFFEIHVELKAGIKPNGTIKDELEKEIFKELMRVNLEYSEYYHNHKENQTCLQPHVKLYQFDKNPNFKKQDSAIKNKYILDYRH
jgi:phenylacetate-CoA ligase